MATSISIIIPAFNSEIYISRCISSILQQKYPDFEIIIVNDGSVDNTRCIIERYVKECNNIKYIEQENHGVSAARNNGLKQATSEYVMFLDSDDELQENSLHIIDDYIKKYKSDVVLYNISRINKESELVGIVTAPISDKAQIYANREDIFKYILLNTASDKFFSSINYIVKRTIAVNYAFKEDMIMYEDVDYAISVLESADSVWYLPDYLYRYRNNENSCVNTFKEQKLKNLEYIYTRKMHYLENTDVFINQNMLDIWLCNNLLSMYYTVVWKRDLRKRYINSILSNDFFRNTLETQRKSINRYDYIKLCKKMPFCYLLYIIDWIKYNIKRKMVTNDFLKEK